MPREAKNRYRNRLSGAMEQATTPNELDLEDDFARAASGEQGRAGQGKISRPIAAIPV